MGDRREEFAMPPEGQGVAGADSDEFAMPTEREAAGAEGDEYGMPAVPRAVRLNFTYAGDDVQLVSRQPVEMLVSPSDPVMGQEAELGSWVEVRNGQEDTLYRRVMPDPFRHDIEVFSPDPQESVSRAPLDVVAGTFSVVVPELDEADHVALLSNVRLSRAEVVGEDSAGGFAAAGEVARFPFRPEGGGR